MVEWKPWKTIMGLIKIMVKIRRANKNFKKTNLRRREFVKKGLPRIIPR